MKTIGVFLSGEPLSGGGFQYEQALVDVFSDLRTSYQVLFFVKSLANAKSLQERGLEAVLFRHGILERLLLAVFEQRSIYGILNRVGLRTTHIDRLLTSHDIGLVFFPSPSRLALSLNVHNFVFTVWDLCHRDFVEFPEVAFYKELEKRDDLYERSLKRAVAVIADSELGRKNAVRRYALDEGRVHVLPLLSRAEPQEAENETDVREKYGIVGDFIFYPAQFWAHKNHIYILDALKLLRDRYSVQLTAVFSGTDKGNLAYVKKMAARLGLNDLVRYTGFVPDLEIAALYRQALAMVMPTYFGPTNIPPLEAFNYGCPVCYSDLPGLRDQVGDAAFLLDLSQPETLVDHLLVIRSNDSVVEEKRALGYQFLENWSVQSFSDALRKIFDAYFETQRRWRS